MKLNPEAPPFTIHELPRATPGSAGLDLASKTDLIISMEEGTVLVPTAVLGTLPEGITGLLLGRSSNFKKGLEVLPGVIDSDSKGEIKIMVKATKKAVIIHQGERIAQILLLPYLKLPNPILKEERGLGEFGSTDHIHWVKEITSSRPMLIIYLDGKKFVGLLDTGADKTCIAGKDWPSHWAIHQTENSLQGLGMASGVAKSSQPLHWQHEGKTGFIQPYVIPTLPFTLWGRDLMQDMDVKLVTGDQNL